MSFFSSESIKPIIESLKHLIDSKADTPNWNETNPSSSSYIKNRPFYEDTETKHVKCIDNHTFTISADAEPIAILPTFSISLGSVYTIVFDGVEYECIAYLPSEMGDVPTGYGLIGSTSVFPEDLPFTGGNDEPFLIVSESGMVGIVTSVGNHTISVSGEITTTTLKKIDKKFLPDSTDVVLDFYDDIQYWNYDNGRKLFKILKSAINNGERIIIKQYDESSDRDRMYIVLDAFVDDNSGDPCIDLYWKTEYSECKAIIWEYGYCSYSDKHALSAIPKTSKMTRKVGVDESSGDLYSEEIISDNMAKTLSNTAVLKEAILSTDFDNMYYSLVYNDSCDQFVAVPYYKESNHVMTSNDGLIFAENGNMEFYLRNQPCATACGNGIIVAAGYTGTYYSNDGGLTWNKSNNHIGNRAKIIFANGVFIAVNTSSTSTLCYYSVDGNNWVYISQTYQNGAIDLVFNKAENRALILRSNHTVSLSVNNNTVSVYTNVALPAPSGVSAAWERILIDDNAIDPYRSIYYFDGKTGLCAYGNAGLVNCQNFEYFVPGADGTTTFEYYIQYSGIINDTLFAISSPTIDSQSFNESVVFTKNRHDNVWEKTVLFDNKYYINQVVMGKDRAIAIMVDRNDNTKIHTAVTFDGKTWSNKIETGNFVTPDGQTVDFIDESALTTMLEEVFV